MLELMKYMSLPEKFEKGKLAQALISLKSGESIGLYLAAQNAGILVWRKDSSTVILEALEAAPRNEDVLAAHDRLTRTFPGRKISLPFELLLDEYFVRAFTSALQQLHDEHVEQFRPKTTKAGSQVVETRGSTHPALVSEYLASVLAVLGHNEAGGDLIKHTREEVLWNRANLPWRRSPLWLVLRVLLQRCLSLMCSKDEAHRHYKNFMLFFLVNISKVAQESHISWDIQHVISLKIARRVFKLGKGIYPNVSRLCSARIGEVRRMLESCWKTIQAVEKRSRALPSSAWAVGEGGSALKLANSQAYLQKIVTRTLRIPDKETFVPSGQSPLQFQANGLPSLGAFLHHQDLPVTLAEFESWVQDHLERWTLDRDGSADDCSALATLIQSYGTLSEQVYESCPRELSLSILTRLELWVCLDKICLRINPLLLRYSPEIPSNLLHPLLLPRLDHLRRLENVEHYLDGRHARASRRNPSIFSDPHKDAFAVQYFKGSEKHQQLKRMIEADAEKSRAEKEKEWKDQSERHTSLLQQSAELECTMEELENGDERHDNRNCQKCKLKSQADNMAITVHEWPLPTNEVQAQTVCFELDRPPGFDAWRETTWTIVQDLGRQKVVAGDLVYQTLFRYSPLFSRAKSTSARISLGSHTKSFLVAHYQTRKFPIHLSNICVNNGLTYRLLDTSKSSWVSDQTSVPDVRAKCTFKIPSGPYNCLQWTVESTSHTQNEVMSKQHEYPPEIEIREYVEFGSMRSGTKLQLLNLLRELGSPNLTLNTVAVQDLLLQTMWQAEAPITKSSHRLAHEVFLREDFCSQLLSVAGRLIDTISASWKEQETMTTLTAVVLRTLSLTLNPGSVARAVKLLRSARTATMNWCQDLTKRLEVNRSEDDNQRTKLLLYKAASSCRSTYDVDRQYVDDILCSDEDMALYIHSSILVHDNTSHASTTASPQLKQMHMRNVSISHALEDKLRQSIQRWKRGIDDALARVWSGVTFRTDWRFLSGTAQAWMTNSTASDLSRTVHFNILTGELLVDGMPLGRISASYEKHSLFQRVFGARVLHVFASDMPGMQYTTAQPIHGHQIHLGMSEGELVIRARFGGRMLEVVPYSRFRTDLPHYFVDEFIHWMDLEASVVEFRPLENAWVSLPQNWKLSYNALGGSEMRSGSERLLDLSCKPAQQVIKILDVMEDQYKIHITIGDSGLLQASLPRFRLQFFVNSHKQLESREFGATVDLSQDIGTLYGLRNKLVLINTASDGGQTGRSVLIPYPDSIRTVKTSDHVTVHLDYDSSDEIRFFRYTVDTHLRRLRGPSDLLSHLFKAYLHASTSHFLPDPFTGLTGTEEALNSLSEESVRVCTPIQADVLQLLNHIASLTPSRSYYPRHLKVMEQVEWDKNLPPLVQHHSFRATAEAILSHANRFAMLYDHQETKPSELGSRGDSPLLKRAAIRNARWRGFDYGGEVVKLRKDRPYQGRDVDVVSARSQRAHHITQLIKAWPQTVNISNDLAKTLRSWDQISGFHTDFAVNKYTDLLSLPIARHWGSLFNLCRRSDRRRYTYKLMFLFSAITFGKENLETALHTLLAFAFSGRFSDVLQSSQASYSLGGGSGPDSQVLDKLIRSHAIAFDCSPPSNLLKNQRLAHRKAAFAEYQKRLTAQIQQLVESLTRQWPCPNASVPSDLQLSLININSAVASCNTRFPNWHRNYVFLKEIAVIQQRLNILHGPNPLISPQSAPGPPTSKDTGLEPVVLPGLDSVLIAVDSCLPEIGETPTPLTFVPALSDTSTFKGVELQAIINKLSLEGNVVKRKYGENLQSSLLALEGKSLPVCQESLPFPIKEFENHKAQMEICVRNTLDAILKALNPATSSLQALREAGLWPRITPRTLLSMLSASRRAHLSDSWMYVLITFGERLTLLQRAERMLSLARQQDIQGLYKELENPGRQGWLPSEYPDWLLIEVENALMIRSMQARVALEMMSPTPRENIVLRLNMGEGKSSVIIPMIAAALAKGEQLLRIVGLKPLLRQTQYVLSQRLGGLVNRRIYHLPFSRKTRLDITVASKIQAIYEEVKDNNGILLTLPEHILSSRLMIRERLESNPGLAARLLDIELWLQENCRDVLDESDEILDTKFQLIYTIGSQEAMDGHPDRWSILQEVLTRVAIHAVNLGRDCPSQFSVESRQEGSFPFVKFLGVTASEELLSRLLSDIENGKIAGLSFNFVLSDSQRAIMAFIQDRRVSNSVAERVMAALAETPRFLVAVLLLRGLIAHGILEFALTRKRWLVEYGLDPSRCLLAVPYRAKGIPSASSEFGHPDVAILLTCLSYYYSGLTFQQLRQCFELLFKDPDARDTYTSWCTASSTLPARLRALEAVNLEDECLCNEQLFPHLTHSKKVADYYMKMVVFPREAKEFLHKLSMSGWDIPAPPCGHITTGFSGTNDNRFLLPLSIKQRDLNELHHTNAMVLHTLLREKNRQYTVAADEHGRRISTTGLLRLIQFQRPQIRVLIDVGAQVLEMDNRVVAKEWLDIVTDAHAAVFFDESDEIMVIERNGHYSRLVSSPFRDKLDHVLIYLDEVHTRGIDLAIPSGARAAVTLGPRLVKDRLVQACMRLRKLGHGHSLAFFAPPEVHRNILDLVGADQSQKLDSFHVVCWVIEQTYQTAQSLLPLWVAQGAEFVRRSQVCERFLASRVRSKPGTSNPHVDEFCEAIKEPEARTLKEMYGVDSTRGSQQLSRLIDLPDHPFLGQLQEVWQGLDASTVSESAVNEEQERELAPEVERVRQLQRPRPAPSAKHQIHRDVRAFITSGILPATSTGIRTAFRSLEDILQGHGLQLKNIPSQVYVTIDFYKVVQPPKGLKVDDYLRPVRWIVSSTVTDTLLVLSPFEANELLPELEKSQNVRLHVYAPRTAKSMVDFTSLDFYVTPSGSTGRWPSSHAIHVLNLFAGSLYFCDERQYTEVCNFLGIVTRRSSTHESDDRIHVSNDGFVGPTGRAILEWPVSSPFTSNPLPFFKSLLSTRMHGQSIAHTHMGYIINGCVLHKESFDEESSATEV